MCGIAAIYAYRDAAPPVDLGELRTIRDHMTARGPDGKGEWISENGRTAMAHRRLAIIDLTEEAAQPMVSDDGKTVISFNGEIYNYQALRAGLVEKGCWFHSHSDTEVLLHLYREKGADMVHDLRGMFAFALWDADKQAMLLARDPYGIKPLYYADDGKTVRVASQVKALAAGGNIPTEKDPAAVVAFHLLGSVPEPYTIYAAIKALPAGSMLWVYASDPGRPECYRTISDIWARAEKAPVQTEDIEAEVREVLLDSVRHHMVSDVPVGVLLSGGVDSSLIVGLLAEQGQAGLNTFSVGFEAVGDEEGDEFRYSDLIAETFGTAHHKIRVPTSVLLENLPATIAAMSEPMVSHDNVGFYLLAQAVSRHLKVVQLSLIHISEPTRLKTRSRMPSSA